MMNKNLIAQIIIDQQNLRFKADDLPRIDKMPANKEIVVISGVRRCGKSTLLHEIRDKNNEPDYYLNFPMINNIGSYLNQMLSKKSL